jgi:hypothetical protein
VRLEAFLHRRGGKTLRFRSTHRFTEEIGVATKILDRRERDGVDSVLDQRVAGSRKPGDPVGESVDETAELIAR